MHENIESFLRVLSPTDNSTGGGTASAVAGAMAAALVAMVARLSIGRPDMEPESFYSEIAFEAEKLSEELMDGGRLDSESFDGVMAAYKMPKNTEAEKENRGLAIDQAFIKATRCPLANAGRCRRVLELFFRLMSRHNRNAHSDLTCAGYLALAGLKGCLDNVAVNLPAIKNLHEAEPLAAQAEELKGSLKSIQKNLDSNLGD